MTASPDATTGGGGPPTVDPRRFRDPGEPYAGHWRDFPDEWSSEQPVLADEMRLQVVDALARLPDRQRVVITFRDIKGYSSAEVCSMLDISASNQRQLLHRARAFVRARLEDYVKARPVTLGPEFKAEPT
jgi:RNA polymerase sigma-70 factor, ECF subfamily